MESPFRVTVYDKAFRRLGWIGDPIGVRMSLRHNATSTAEVALTADHRLVPALAEPGSRITLAFRGTQVLSGQCRLRGGEGPGRAGVISLGIEDDFRLLHTTLGWPVPNASLTGQSVAYDTRTGPAESVAKGFVQANAVQRLGLPLTVAPSQGRGANITVSLRMHPLADRLLGPVEQAGIGLSVRQQGVGLIMDAYVPRQYPRTLTEASGAVSAWSWTQAAPEATRVVAGLQGEAESRLFYGLADLGREAEWGDKIEVFRDARDLADNPAIATERMQETLAEGAPTSGLSISLSETGTFTYDPTGEVGVRVGDRIRVQVGPGVIVEDVLREAELDWSFGSGLVITPLVGDRANDPDRIFASAIASLARGYRNLTAGR